MLNRLIEWLIGCSTSLENPTWYQVLISAFRCLVRFGLVIALIYALSRFGLVLTDAL